MYHKGTIISIFVIPVGSGSGYHRVTTLKQINMKDAKFCNSACPLTRSVGQIGNKWKPLIIFTIQTRKLRFGQLDALIPMITRKVLTEQLRELVDDGILLRNAFGEIPPRVEYSLTEKGLALVPIFTTMMNWNLTFDGGFTVFNN